MVIHSSPPLPPPVRLFTRPRPPSPGSWDWSKQRLSAVALLILGPWILYDFWHQDLHSYSHMMLWISQLKIGTGLMMVSFAFTYHGFLGMKMVIEDYIRSPWKRHSLLFFLQGILWAFMISLGFLLISLMMKTPGS